MLGSVAGWRRFSLLAGLALAVALIPGTAHAADWPTFHGDNSRQGNDSSDPGLSSPGVAWTSAQLDGQVHGQPVVVGNQVVVATENNTVYSLSAADGTVQWSTHVAGAPRTSNFACGNIRPLGITGTPVIDGGNVFVAAEVQQNPTTFIFDLVSLSLATGAVSWTHNIDPPDAQWNAVAQYQQQRGALLVTGGRVIVPLGGLDGDCGTYHGYVLGYPESGSGGVTWWASSEVVGGDREGSIWAAGGLSEDSSGFIYAGTGNSNQTAPNSPYDYSDGVIKLSPGSLAPGSPVDYFAPTTWYQDNAGDVDLGSTTPLQLPNARVFVVGKSGVGYLLNAASLGHIGGQIAQHRVCSATNAAAFGSLAYANGIAYVGCSTGLTAVQINGAGNDFATLWHNTSAVTDHPPTIAGGLVWSISPGGNTLYAFNTSTGQAVASFPVSASHFTTPTAANGQLFVAGGNQVHAFDGCTGPPLTGDFTGDGKADVLSVGPAGTCVLPSTGAAFTAPSPWSSVPFYGSEATLSADVSGDHRSDLVAVNNSSTWVMPSTGSAFSAPQRWSATPFYGQRATLAGDLNGAGRADLIAVNSASSWVMLNTGSGFSAPQKWSALPFYGGQATMAGDVNGDGRTDLVAVNNSSVWVMVSSGSGFSAPQPWHSGAFYGKIATLGGDLNGDGTMDLVAVNPAGTWVMLDTGSGFSSPAKWWAGYP